MGWWVSGILVTLILVLRVGVIFVKLGLRKRPIKLKYPPSPRWCWPVIGHFHIMMTRRPHHRVLSELADIYGGLYYLRLGSVHTLVVSDSKWAQELLHRHDRHFSDRPKSEAARRLFYGSRTLVMMKYGATWRQTRRLYTLHLLTWRRISAFEGERKAEVARAVACLRGAKGAVRVRDLVFDLVGNMMTRMLFSRRAFRDDEHVASMQARGFKDMVVEMALLFGAPVVGDVVPWLGWVDKFGGFTRRMDKLAARIDCFLEGLLSDRLRQNKNENENKDDFLGFLIQAYQDDTNGHIAIKSILLDLLSAGTETSTTTVEWVMAELMRNPAVMRKLQRELRTATKTNINDIEVISTNDTDDNYSPSSADIPSLKLPYLQAVIKETLRLHPPLPLLVRQMNEEVGHAETSLELGSAEHGVHHNYRLPNGTRLVVNVWAIGRDVAVWGDDADVFLPERFLETNESTARGMHSLALLQQQQFEMLPFGYGRRGCPGANLGLASVSLVVANLVHHFDWSQLEQLGQGANEVQLKEVPLSHTAPMDVPLVATPTPRCMDGS